MNMTKEELKELNAAVYNSGFYETETFRIPTILITALGSIDMAHIVAVMYYATPSNVGREQNALVSMYGSEDRLEQILKSMVDLGYMTRKEEKDENGEMEWVYSIEEYKLMKDTYECLKTNKYRSWTMDIGKGN